MWWGEVVRAGERKNGRAEVHKALSQRWFSVRQPGEEGQRRWSSGSLGFSSNLQAVTPSPDFVARRADTAASIPWAIFTFQAVLFDCVHLSSPVLYWGCHAQPGSWAPSCGACHGLQSLSLDSLLPFVVCLFQSFVIWTEISHIWFCR